MFSPVRPGFFCFKIFFLRMRSGVTHFFDPSGVSGIPLGVSAPANECRRTTRPRFVGRNRYKPARCARARHARAMRPAAPRP